MDFLNEEAQKIGAIGEDDDDDDLEEESLLETPLDKVEPYALLKLGLMSMYCFPQFCDLVLIPYQQVSNKNSHNSTRI